jgi:putative transposase
LLFVYNPNHFHLALWPETDDGLSALMHWLLTTHATRYLRQYRATGHVWQGRFRAFPIHEDDHLLTVLRYIERNPLRAGLVASAQEWRWPSLRWHVRAPNMSFLHVGPVQRPSDWVTDVNSPQTEAGLDALRRCAERGTPFGDAVWVGTTAAQLGLEYTLRPRGRPPRRVQPSIADGIRAPLFDQPVQE